jgi:hypothetical protein
VLRGDRMLGRHRLVAACLGLLATLACGCAEEGEAASAPAVAAACAPNSVTYVTNVYLAPGQERATAVPGPVVRVERSDPPPPSTGLATCDSYLETTRRCAHAVTADADALARFDHAMEVTLNEARIVMHDGDRAAREALSARCEAALHAYDEAPCAPP